MTATGRVFAWILALTAWSWLTPLAGADDAVVLMLLYSVAWIWATWDD